jgi:hypothetical protein
LVKFCVVCHKFPKLKLKILYHVNFPRIFFVTFYHLMFVYTFLPG